MALAANVHRRSRIAIPSRPPPLRDSPNSLNGSLFVFHSMENGRIYAFTDTYRIKSILPDKVGSHRARLKRFLIGKGRESLDLPRFRTHPEIPRSFHAKLSLRALNEGAKGVIHIYIYIYVTRIYIHRARERIIPKGRGG